MKFRSRFDDHTAASRAAIFVTNEPSRTKQSFKDECDINLILKNYRVTGVLPNNSRAALAQYGDFSQVPNYETALNRVLEAQEMFNDMPAVVRARFGNDPGRLLGFLSDSQNRDEAVRLGLLAADGGVPPVGSGAPAPRREQSDSSGLVPTPKGKGGQKRSTGNSESSEGDDNP